MAKKYFLYGKEFSLAELCRLYGQHRSTVEGRLKKGVPLERALIENGRYKLNTQLLILSDKLKDLKAKKSELDAQTKSVNEEIDGITVEMIELMTNEELTSFKRDGTTFSLVTQEYPAPEPDRKPDLWVFGPTISDGMKTEIERARKSGIRTRYFSENLEEG